VLFSRGLMDLRNDFCAIGKGRKPKAREVIFRRVRPACVVLVATTRSAMSRTSLNRAVMNAISGAPQVNIGLSEFGQGRHMVAAVLVLLVGTELGRRTFSDGRPGTVPSRG